MKPLGIHLIVDAWECPADLLNDPGAVSGAIRAAAEAGGAKLIDLCTHQFSPHGITATATLAESHIAIHTWPEHGYFAADLFLCGAGDPYRALDALRHALQVGELLTTELKRGLESGRPLRQVPGG